LAEGEIRNIFGKILIRSSYLVGHVHGLGKTVAEMAPQYDKLINEKEWFSPIFELHHSNLREMHSTYGKSTSMDVFGRLATICEATLNSGGLHYVKQSDGESLVKFQFTS
jgi:hypothetical protein